MTTLPQTTPVRLPQTALGAAAVPTVHTPPTMGGGGGIGFTMTGADVWRVIRNNLWLVILFLIIFGAAGWVVNEVLRQKMPRFTATGLLEIRTQGIVDPLTGSRTEMDQSRLLAEQRTQAQLLKTDPIFSELLKKPLIRDSATFARYLQTNEKGEKVLNARLAREFLKESLSVTPVSDSKLLTVSAEASTPEDAKLVVDTLVELRLDQTKRSGEDRVREQTKALDDLLNQIKSDMDGVHNRLSQMRQGLNEHGMSAPGLSSTKEIDYRVLKEEQERFKETGGKFIAEYENMERTKEKTGKIPEVEQLLDNDPMIVRYQAEVNQWQIELDLLKSRAPGNPKIEEIQQRIDLIRQQMDARKVDQRTKLTLMIEGSAAAKAQSAKEQMEDYSRKVAAAEKDLQALAREMQELEDLKDKDKSLTELYNQTQTKRREVGAAINAASDSSIITWASHPEVPDQPSFPSLKITLALALFLGLCLSLGIAFLRELLDDTVRRPSDIVRVGHMTTLGIIADEADDPQVAGASLAIFDAPHSLTAEQFRQLRTRLQHAASLDTTRSIMVTGPGPEDGKTTVAVNLAAGLALNGRKILLVDSNFRRPEIHRLFGISNDRGFSDVLNGTAALEELAQQSRVPNLAVLTAGPKPVNATELFESQLLIDFIDRALEEYDHVIFDSGPFLVVSEASAMAPRVDGVVTVIRAHAESRGLLQRMRDALKQIKAEHLGVVLNAVRAQGGGYYRRNIKAFYDYQSAA